jgi:CrcB protein
MLYLIVFLGAGIGGAMRHGVNVAATRLFGLGFPYGTFIVNVLGSFAMGLFAGYFAYRAGIPQHVRLFLTTGILGGFTTFSTYAVDLREQLGHGHPAGAAAYLLVSLVGGILAVVLGLRATSAVLTRS